MGRFLGIDELASFLGRRPRVLAWARADGDLVAGLLDGLAVRESGAWGFTPWDEIEHGGWDGRELSWRGGDGRRRTFALTAPGRLPELFHERVQASILGQWPVRWDGGSASVVLRRNPGLTDAPARWRVIASPGVAVDGAPARQAIAAAMRAGDWDIG